MGDVSEFPSVPIHIYGALTVSVPDLVEIFQRHGCPRDLAYRVAADVLGFRSRRTKVLPSVDIEALRRDLARCGLNVEKLGV